MEDGESRMDKAGGKSGESWSRKFAIRNPQSAIRNPQFQSCRFALTYDSRATTMAFFAHFVPFCGKSMEVPFLEPFTGEAGLFGAKPGRTQSNPVKPSQTIFLV
jgi:hypothetical protein